MGPKGRGLKGRRWVDAALKAAGKTAREEMLGKEKQRKGKKEKHKRKGKDKSPKAEKKKEKKD